MNVRVDLPGSCDLHQQLAEVLALEQAKERGWRILQALDHVLAILDAAAAHPFAHVAQEIRLSSSEIPDDEAAQGLVSRVTPVHTAMRNCTGDEGRPFGFGDQVADPKPPQAAVVKSDGGERCGNVGAMIPAGKVERGERKQTASEASKAV
jgi:hypothetical protein